MRWKYFEELTGQFPYFIFDMCVVQAQLRNTAGNVPVTFGNFPIANTNCSVLIIIIDKYINDEVYVVFSNTIPDITLQYNSGIIRWIIVS